MERDKFVFSIATLIAISFLFNVAMAQTSDAEIESITSQIANLMQQITRLQNSLETIAPQRLRCNSDSDCSFCGAFCVNKDIARYCPQVQPRPGSYCACEEGRCVTRMRTECIRDSPEVQINPSSRIAEPGEQAIYQGIIRSRDSRYCNSSSFDIEINCPQNFVCSVSPLSVNISNTITSVATFRISVQSPRNASVGSYNFTVLVINRDNRNLVTRAVGRYIIAGKEDRPSGTLRVDNRVVKIGENITLTIEASDDNGLESVMAFFKGRWSTKNCNREKTCEASFTFVEESPGIKFYYGYVRGYTSDGNRIEGEFTRPPFVEVRVVEEIPRNECIRGVPSVQIEPKFRKGTKGDNFSFAIIVKSTDRNCERSSFRLEAECQEGLECTVEPSKTNAISTLWVKTEKVNNIGSYKIRVKAINEYDNRLIGETEATVEIIREEIGQIIRIEDRPSGSLRADKYVIAPGENVSITISAKDDNGLHSISLYTPQRVWETFDCKNRTTCNKTWTFKETTIGTKDYYGLIRGYKTDGSIEIVYTMPPVVTIVVREIYQPPVEVPGRMTECNNNTDCFWCGNNCIRARSGIMCPTVVPPSGYECVCENGRCTAKLR